jgi:hypothetical protein
MFRGVIGLFALHVTEKFRVMQGSRDVTDKFLFTYI